VMLGDKSACLRCEVRARPTLTALFWVIDDNGTTVYEGQRVDDRYWTLIFVCYFKPIYDSVGYVTSSSAIADRPRCRVG